MLVHPDDEAGLQSGVVDEAEPAETRIVRPSQRDTGADPTEPEWAVISYQMGIGRDHARFPDSDCFCGHVLWFLASCRRDVGYDWMEGSTSAAGYEMAGRRERKRSKPKHG
jgi:hypothetical protein